MPLWRDLLQLSAQLNETGEIQAIAVTGMDRVAVSQHYANRTNYTLRAVKTIALIDCNTSVVLDVHFRRNNHTIHRLRGSYSCVTQTN